MFDSLRENFEVILIVLFALSAVAYIIYRLTFFANVKNSLAMNAEELKSLPKKKRKALASNLLTQQLNTPFKKIIHFFADLFWVLLFVVVVRSFIYEPFIIPSGSMKPGLLVGDIILVDKNKMGIRLPITNTRITDGEAVSRGDVIVFKFPNDPNISYVKRVIGIPGDTVYYDNRNMTLNGEKVSYEKLKEEADNVEFQTITGTQTVSENYTVYNENLAGYKHIMRYSQHRKADFPAREWTVPAGKYLVMGDNRDNSSDGRAFGFLDDKLLIGKATRIAFNWECLKGNGNCDRFFKKIQ